MQNHFFAKGSKQLFYLPLTRSNVSVDDSEVRKQIGKRKQKRKITWGITIGKRKSNQYQREEL